MTAPETSRYYTPKLGLLAPSLDDELDACRPNWERLDKAYAGATWVAPGLFPDQSQLFDGAIIAEYTTGIVWRAQKNASGVYEKRYLRYPWFVSLSQPNLPVQPGAAGTWIMWGWTVVDTALCFNVDSSALTQNRLVIPVTGIYQGGDWIHWLDNPSGPNGLRAHTMIVNDLAGGTQNLYSYEDSTYPMPELNNSATTCVKINQKFNKGDTICSSVWQNSGVACPTNHTLRLALVRTTA